MIKSNHQRHQDELEVGNTMWIWVAGAMVLALILVFVFTRDQMDEPTPVPAARETTALGTCKFVTAQSDNEVLLRCTGKTYSFTREQ